MVAPETESGEGLMFPRILVESLGKELLVRNGEVSVRLISALMCSSLATVKSS